VKRAGELAAKQFGAISRRQLLHVGFSEGRIARWLEAGRLHPRYPGAYALGRRDLCTPGQLAAALLFAGRGAALAGLTTLWWLGLLGRRPARIHIDAPGRVRSFADIAIRHPEHIERLWHRDLPVTPLPTALLAATADLSHDSLRLVLARADFQKILDLRAIEAAMGRGVGGSRKLRAALGSHLPQLARCANGFERDFVLLCERHSLPIPEPNVRIGRYVPDMLWPDQRLIVELDGGDAHSSAAQLQADRERQAWLEARGYSVLRFTPDELRSAPRGVIATTARRLSQPVRE
jgi:hypothetical protein